MQIVKTTAAVDSIRTIIGHSASGTVPCQVRRHRSAICTLLLSAAQTGIGCRCSGRHGIFCIQTRSLLLSESPAWHRAGLSAAWNLRRYHPAAQKQRPEKGSQELKALAANIPAVCSGANTTAFLPWYICSDGFSASTGFTSEEIDRLFHNQFIRMYYKNPTGKPSGTVLTCSCRQAAS